MPVETIKGKSTRVRALNQLQSDINQQGIIVVKEPLTEQIEGEDPLWSNGKRFEFLYNYFATHLGIFFAGSARIAEDEEAYKQFRELGYSIAESLRYDVDFLTGGGPAMMKAPLEGSSLAIQEAAKKGVPLTIRNIGQAIRGLNREESPNGFLHNTTYHVDFLPRIARLTEESMMTIGGDGGFGSLDELTRPLVDKQTGHFEKDYPIIVSPHYEGLLEWAYQVMYKQRVDRGLTPYINLEDLNLVKVTNKIPEIVDIASIRYQGWRHDIRDHVQIAA